MHSFRSNCETFRVRTNGYEARVAAERGFAVVDSWIHGVRGSYLDPQVEPGHKDSYLPSIPGNLFMQFDGQEPPAARNGVVKRLSIGMDVWMGASVGLPLAEDSISPLVVYGDTQEEIGKAALVSIIDRHPDAYNRRAANIQHQLGTGYEVLKEYRAGDIALVGAGISVVLIEENGSVVVGHYPVEGDEAQKYSLRYIPDSRAGIVVNRINKIPPSSREEDPRDRPDDPGDGGSDRVPRRPIIPFGESGAEADIPEGLDVLALYGGDVTGLAVYSR
jgi:hypothetical protein